MRCLPSGSAVTLATPSAKRMTATLVASLGLGPNSRTESNLADAVVFMFRCRCRLQNELSVAFCLGGRAEVQERESGWDAVPYLQVIDPLVHRIWASTVHSPDHDSVDGRGVRTDVGPIAIADQLPVDGHRDATIIQGA